MSGPQLNFKMVLEEPLRVPDGAGGYTQTWNTVGTLWGAVVARGAADGDVAAGPISRLRYRVTLRGAAADDPARPRVGQRLRLGGRVLTVDGVVDAAPDARFLTVWASEEVLP